MGNETEDQLPGPATGWQAESRSLCMTRTCEDRCSGFGVIGVEANIFVQREFLSLNLSTESLN